MRAIIIFLFIDFLAAFNGTSQLVKDNYYRKGNFSIYWGWNRAAFTTSDIQFTGDDYNFTLKDVIAKDRQSAFEPNLYFNPKTVTIPQYNFRIGYFLHDHYQISFGADHMKYVVQAFQDVKIDGFIHSGTSYDGDYVNDFINLKKDFLQFEHTDGLNYENFELRRFDVVLGRKNIALAFNEGIGIGFLLPRTNTTLLNNPRYDEFHLAGFGTSIVLAANLTFFKYFFIQMEWKGGYINMPDIRTTMNTADRAKQQFLFSQYNIFFGANFRFKHLKKDN